MSGRAVGDGVGAWRATAAAVVVAVVAVLVPAGTAPPASAAVTVEMVEDIHPDGSAVPANFVAVGGTLFFTANDDVHGSELWKSDGTAAGTMMVEDINTDGDRGSVSGELLEVDGAVLFVANDGADRELWRSDGTPEGTMLVKDIDPIASSEPQELTVVGDQLFFIADDGTQGAELWKSDGTADGTVMVKDISPGAKGSFDTGVQHDILAAVGDTLYFIAENRTQDISGPHELWKSDGTAAGTVPLTTDSDGTHKDLTAVGDTLFFVGFDNVVGLEVWKSDGTPEGTGMVAAVAANGSFGEPAELTDVGGTLFFSVDDGVHGYELWKSDGTALGTVMVADIRAEGGSAPVHLTHVQGTLFFSARDDTGQALWTSDGTAGGTTLVDRVTLRADLVDVGGTLFFAGYEGSSLDAELWTTDGTAAGTFQVADVDPAGSSGTRLLIDVGGTLFFRADDGIHGTELWKATVPATPVEHAPTATIDSAPATLVEGASATLSGTVTDPDAGDTPTGLWSADPGCTITDPTDVAAATVSCADDGTYTVTLTADDGSLSGTDTASVTVLNAAPTVTITSPPAGTMAPAASPLQVTATFSDPGTADAHTCAVTWPEASAPVTGAVDATAGTCTASPVFATAGVYDLAVTVTDDDGATGTSAALQVVVFDPGASVRGNGTIDSPAGAYPADPTLAGEARFGFTSRYRNGATQPSGTTRFVFRTAGLSFSSDQYDWLVVAGARAQFKGEGTLEIDRTPRPVAFMVTALDAETSAGPDDADSFRLKIWDPTTDEILYDNALGASDDAALASSTEVVRGQVVITRR